MSLWSRLVNALRNERLIDDIDEELSSHIADSIESGRDPEEARRAFGPHLRHREASRDARRVVWLGDLVMDVRYGARILRRQPVFLAAAVLSLGIGIGATTAIFSVIDALLLRPLAVNRPEQLVTLRDSVTGNFSYPAYVLMRDGTRTLADILAASSTRPINVEADGSTQQASVKMVSGNYFTALGIGAEMGRMFSSAEETFPVAVLSDGYWRRRFGATAGVLGQTVRIDGVAVSIVGIAPPGFSGEMPGDSPDVWTSLVLQPAESRADQGFTWLYLMGRRHSGRTLAQIHDDLVSLLVQARPTAPSPETRARLVVGPGAHGIPILGEHLADPLRVAMILAGLVLLLVCTNLAGLLLARGTARRAEMAMRLAIGASRTRLLRQLLTESLLLAAWGGTLGMIIATWGVTALLRIPIGSHQAVVHLVFDARVLAFTAGVSTIAALLFGLAPAWQATRATALRGSAHGITPERGGRLRSGVIAIQVALSMLLLAGSLMFIRTIHNIESQHLGFRADGLLVVQIAAERGSHPPMTMVIPALLARVSHLPGVSSASVAIGGTFAAIGGARVHVEGRPTRDRLDADWVGPDYLRTAGIALIAGRDFAVTDNGRHAKVVIVNDTMARRFFQDGRALGRHVTFGNDSYEIVGVASDAKYFDPGETTPAFVYFPTLQTGSGFNTLELRMGTRAHVGLASTIASVVHEVDPRLRTTAAMTLSDRIDRRLGAQHLVAGLSGWFGSVALALLAIGIYGSVAYTVGQRSKEIAVRLALGARRAAVVWMVIRQIVVVLAWGLAGGGVGVLLTGSVVKRLLFGVSPTDPVTLVGASVVIVSVALTAGGLPARAAARLDPAVVLRE